MNYIWRPSSHWPQRWQQRRKNSAALQRDASKPTHFTSGEHSGPIVVRSGPINFLLHQSGEWLRRFVSATCRMISFNAPTSVLKSSIFPTPVFREAHNDRAQRAENRLPILSVDGDRKVHLYKAFLGSIKTIVNLVPA